MSAPFIVFEGPDGAGKSTQVRLLADRLRLAGRDALVIREPGGTPLGERIRQLILDPASGSLGLRAEILLYMTARAQLVEEVLRPAIEAGRVVLCDRYYYSTIAYQGYGGGEDPERIRDLARYATQGLEPDRIVLLDLSPQRGLDRLPKTRDRIERRGNDYFERVRQAFRSLAKDDPRWIIVDATQSMETIHERLWSALALLR